MMSHICTNDSDSESLPELSDLLPAPSNEILKGDIVWARFKKLYWPALVRNVYHKEKKVTIWYTDDPGKNFKLPLKNVFLFHDREMSAKIKNDVKETGCHQTNQAHEGLTAHAMTYLNRKAQGCNDDPLKFFDQTYPFFLMEDFYKKNPNADMDMKVEPMYLNHNVRTAEIRKNGRASGGTAAYDSEIESTEDESDGEGLSCQYKKNNILTLPNSLNAAENEFVDKIVKCVTSGKADTHLAKVISKAILSDHHEFYLKAIHSDKRDLNFISFGPVRDIEKLREIACYLIDLYNLKFSKEGKKHRRKSGVSHLDVSKNDQAQYVTSVWLPESIIFAISEINNISMAEAKKLFYPESDVIAKEVKNIDSLNKNVNISEVTDAANERQRTESDEESKEESSPKRSRLILSDVLKVIESKKYNNDATYIPEIPIPESNKKTSKEITPKRKRRRRKSYK